MVTQTLTCAHCASVNMIRHGHARNGKCRFRCHDCNRTCTQNPATRRTDPKRKAQILAAYHERSSLRGLARVFKVSRNTVTGWLKKSPVAPAPGADPGPGSG